jgi:hypothetical protein
MRARAPRPQQRERCADRTAGEIGADQFGFFQEFAHRQHPVQMRIEHV